MRETGGQQAPLRAAAPRRDRCGTNKKGPQAFLPVALAGTVRAAWSLRAAGRRQTLLRIARVFRSCLDRLPFWERARAGATAAGSTAQAHRYRSRAQESHRRHRACGREEVPSDGEPAAAEARGRARRSRAAPQTLRQPVSAAGTTAYAIVAITTRAAVTTNPSSSRRAVRCTSGRIVAGLPVRCTSGRIVAGLPVCGFGPPAAGVTRVAGCRRASVRAAR
jgi:hypothetical protein